MRVREWKARDGNLISKFFLLVQALESQANGRRAKKEMNESLIPQQQQQRETSSRFHRHAVRVLQF